MTIVIMSYMPYYIQLTPTKAYKLGCCGKSSMINSKLGFSLDRGDIA